MQGQVLESLLAIVFVLVMVAVVVFIFRWLWNTTMPQVFGIREITFWQAVRLLLLAGILFGGHAAVQMPQHMAVDELSRDSQGQ